MLVLVNDRDSDKTQRKESRQKLQLRGHTRLFLMLFPILVMLIGSGKVSHSHVISKEDYRRSMFENA